MRLKYNNLSLGFIGDIHGDFQSLQKIIRPYENTVFIVCGDCGFGFPDTKEDKIRKMIKAIFSDFLKKRNLYLLFVRGNHDDPKFFQDDGVREKINTSRFILLEDYSVVQINTTKVLCVGGAVSIDRKLRTTDSSYWYGEEMLDFEEIDRFDIDFSYISEDIDILCTHTTNKQYINHLLPTTDFHKICFKEDKKLIPDFEREFNICNNLFIFCAPKYWIHGHFHLSAQQDIFECKLISLDINELYEFRQSSYESIY